MEVMYVYEIIAGKRGPFPKFITGLSTGSPCSPMSQACLGGTKGHKSVKSRMLSGSVLVLPFAGKVMPAK